MKEIKKHQPGNFSWNDLLTTDAKAAKAFYGKLFGYTAEDTPAGPDSAYTMFNLHNKAVAAMYERSAEQKEQGIPPHWDSYITVENVDEACKKVKALEGTVIQEPFDVMEAGRMGIIKDPTGAVLALWQPNENIGSEITGIPGTVVWNELGTNNTEKANKFYTQLLDWDSETSEMINTVYTAFLLEKKPVAGMFQMPPEMGDTPSQWVPYFSVEDCDASVKIAQELGANVLQPPTDIPGTGRFSMLQDPQGAAFGILQSEPMEEQE